MFKCTAYKITPIPKKNEAPPLFKSGASQFIQLIVYATASAVALNSEEFPEEENYLIDKLDNE